MVSQHRLEAQLQRQLERTQEVQPYTGVAEAWSQTCSGVQCQQCAGSRCFLGHPKLRTVFTCTDRPQPPPSLPWMFLACRPRTVRLRPRPSLKRAPRRSRGSRRGTRLRSPRTPWSTPRLKATRFAGASLFMFTFPFLFDCARAAWSVSHRPYYYDIY